MGNSLTANQTVSHMKGTSLFGLWMCCNINSFTAGSIFYYFTRANAKLFGSG